MRRFAIRAVRAGRVTPIECLTRASAAVAVIVPARGADVVLRDRFVSSELPPEQDTAISALVSARAATLPALPATNTSDQHETTPAGEWLARRGCERPY